MPNLEVLLLRELISTREIYSQTKNKPTDCNKSTDILCKIFKSTNGSFILLMTPSFILLIFEIHNHNGSWSMNLG